MEEKLKQKDTDIVFHGPRATNFFIFAGGLSRSFWSLNILICTTMKTYLLCFPKYS